MKNKNLNLLFVSGLISFMGGAVCSYVDQRLNLITGALGLWGIAAMAICLIVYFRSTQGGRSTVRLKKTGLISLIIILSVVFFVGTNYFASKLPWRWDVTRSKQHTLSSATIKYIRGLKQNVKFSALYVGVPPTYLEDLFKEYEKASHGRIKTEIIDPIEQIGYAAQFGNIINGQQKKVIVISGKERRDLDFTSAPLSEDQLTNAVVRVTRKERHIYFLTGHGENSILDKDSPGLFTLTKLLAANNMSSQEMVLGLEPVIPPDCDVLVVAGAQKDLTKVEVDSIEQYLEQGGKALFLIGSMVITTPEKPLTDDELHKSPSLNAILNQWGINVGEDLVLDLDSHAGEDLGSPATRNYARGNPITDGLDYTFYVRPRSITELKNHRPSIALGPIVMTQNGDKCWAHTDRTTKVYYDPKTDTLGPIALAYGIIEKKKDITKPDTRIIVFTNVDFLTNIYIDQYSNGRMGLNVINWLAETNSRIFVDPKDIKVERLDLTSRQKRQVAAMLFLMPVFIAVCGIMVWMKR